MPYNPQINLQVGDGKSINAATLNYLAPTSFKLSIDRLTYPNTEYNIQTVAMPSMIVDGAQASYKTRNLQMTGDKVNYGQLTVVFLVDEEMQNYREIHDWIIGNVTNEDAPRDGKVRDLTLSILSSHNNVTKEIVFVDAFPIDLGSLPFDIQATDIEYLTATVTFQYSYFKFV